MANRSTYSDIRDTPLSDNVNTRQASSSNALSSECTHITRLTSQHHLSDSRTPTKCFILFEDTSSTDSNEICFLEYRGTRARNHHQQKLYLPQVVSNNRKASDDAYEQFARCVKEVLNSIPEDDLTSYVVSVRTGVSYFFSKRFRFKKTYSIEEIHDIIQKKISTSDEQYYHPRTNNNQSDDSLRSSFSNVKPISRPAEFVNSLQEYQFYVKKQKHVFRIYLQSEDKQTHVCTVDPALNYSIVEFSKDFQRTSNIDLIRDRSSSKFYETKTFDDIFDFRIQFQYNPCTRSDQMNTIEYELHQQFPLLDPHFKNENILQPFNNNNMNDDQELVISKQLYPYVKFIRRDFGDVYQYEGNDQLFENFNIFLESSVEYHIDLCQSTCKRELDSRGLVYARLDLNTMVSSNSLDQNLLISKLWDMGIGLTSIAGRCTTSETQQSTNYYSRDGITFNAEDESLVQTILKQSTLHSMLGLPKHATDNNIKNSFRRITNQLESKWHCFRCGNTARDKLYGYYEQYFNEQR